MTENTRQPQGTKIPWRPSASLLLLAGLAVAAIGIYFLVPRPPLLPEHFRFLEGSAVDIAGATSQLAIWLSHVLRVLGGYALATGLLTIALAATSYRRREPLAIAGAVAGGVSGIVTIAIDANNPGQWAFHCHHLYDMAAGMMSTFGYWT